MREIDFDRAVNLPDYTNFVMVWEFAGNTWSNTMRNTSGGIEVYDHQAGIWLLEEDFLEVFKEILAMPDLKVFTTENIYGLQ